MVYGDALITMKKTTIYLPAAGSQGGGPLGEEGSGGGHCRITWNAGSVHGYAPWASAKTRNSRALSPRTGYVVSGGSADHARHLGYFALLNRRDRDHERARLRFSRIRDLTWFRPGYSRRSPTWSRSVSMPGR